VAGIGVLYIDLYIHVRTYRSYRRTYVPTRRPIDPCLATESTFVPSFRPRYLPSLRVHTYLRVYVPTVVLSLLPLVTTACITAACSNYHVPTYLVHSVYLPTIA